MGKPRMIILIRHAQSEGNKNRDIHQFIPDHRVKLTPDGWQQAEEAGRRLRSMLKPDDTLQFFTSPYRRTRETTEGILQSLTSDDPTPSPFKRHKIKVFEEPRLREQDFGNFQPCSAEMERMWQERADYGHFFYRIPNGESAADAYDRVSGFNESMWRLFGEEDFPSVCVLVTHGLMTRVFLMKWYHWSVEYFEDLRNVNHCEFIIMKQNPSNGKYILENELRTWSELKKRAIALNTNIAPSPTKGALQQYTSPTVPTRRWGGCANGCNHASLKFPRRYRRQNTGDYAQGSSSIIPEKEKEDTPIAPQEASHATIAEIAKSTPTKAGLRALSKSPSAAASVEPPFESPSADGDIDARSTSSSDLEASTAIPHSHQHPTPQIPHPNGTGNSLLRRLHFGRDFGGSRSGAATPAEGFSDDSDYAITGEKSNERKSTLATSMSHSRANGSTNATSSIPRHNSVRSIRKSEQEWVQESGMGSGARANALGDGDCSCEDEVDTDEIEVVQELAKSSIRANGADPNVSTLDEIERTVEKMKDRDRKSFREIY